MKFENRQPFPHPRQAVWAQLFSADYEATLSGDRMTGVVMANGYKGPFTATR
jgi:hypothetical protein